MINNKIIYHVFRADVYFMTSSMIENIITTSKFNHFFIVVGVNDKNGGYFIELFTKYGHKNFLLINERSNNKKSILFSEVFKKYLNISLEYWELDLRRFLSNLRNPTILIHAECSVMFSFLLSLKAGINKNLVIWGSILDPKNYSILYFKLRKRLYKNYLNIVCLMPEDCKKLIDFYESSNGIYIPYISDIFLMVNRVPLKRECNSNSTKILLGNSGRCIGSYYVDLNTLGKFNDESITIDCMLNYGCTQEESNKIIGYACKIYDIKFKAHTTLWSKERVYNFINGFDIYISSRSDQSGLGTMYFAILFGLKLFLSGNNYLYFKNLGIKIFHTDEIKELTYCEFSQPLTEDEKRKNYDLLLKALDLESVVSKWEKFYDKIINLQTN